VKTFVVGDIHGAFRAFIQCLERSGFDYENDSLISLGDVFDGWSEIPKVLDEMLKIKRLVYVLGNHDEFALKWAETGIVTYEWLINSGQTTINSYPGGIPDKHLDIIKNSVNYYLSDNKLFVHGGIQMNLSLEKQSKDTCLWDRNLFNYAMFHYFNKRNFKIAGYDEIYIGHSPLSGYNIYRPLKSGNVCMMDTGAGWTGCLSMMNIDNGEIYTSDNVTDLYPNETGRYG
jgi:serine/threonine protein phosphatase 1